ncbi:MAG: hypothetical protein ACXWZM_09385 [Solirubrobacterales bacterium]
MGIFDPITQPDPQRDDRGGANGDQLEIRPQQRVAHLASRSLACPECGVPVAISGPVGWEEPIACAFYEASAPTREFVREEGWPRVALIARIG